MTEAMRRALEKYHNRLKESGRCRRCGKPLEEDRIGKWTCLACQEKEKASQKKRRDERRAKGLCINCGKPLEPERAGRNHCAACAKKRGDEIKLRQMRWAKEGICVDCGKAPAQNGRMRCFDCLRHKAEYQNRRNAEKKGTES